MDKIFIYIETGKGKSTFEQVPGQIKGYKLKSVKATEHDDTLYVMKWVKND